MDKITFTQLGIELNRQCNFRCEHCFCGENEGFFDFNYEKLDLLLDQTLVIACLDFMGGEPTLSLNIMNKILDKIRERKIPICKFFMITNGSCDIKLLKDFIIKLNEYMSIFLSKPISAKDMIHIGISNDYYHYKFIDCKNVYNNFQKEIGEYCTLFLNNRGEITEKKGRAENLEYSGDNSTPYKECKIPYFIQGKQINKKYRCSESIKFYYENQIIIPCYVIFGNDGKLYNGYREFMPYKQRDKMNGVEVTDNLLKSLDKYNFTVPICHKLKRNYDRDDIIIGYLNNNKEQVIKDMKKKGYEVESIFNANDKKVLDDVLLCLHQCVEGYEEFTYVKKALSTRMSKLEEQNKIILDFITKLNNNK